ncbi:MAG: hypothetical protein CMH12_02445 [Maritimibacter sp.]|mgnify:CR=1 FL=1|nr:hypothetical protein [Maritimibacter sp.]
MRHVLAIIALIVTAWAAWPDAAAAHEAMHQAHAAELCTDCDEPAGTSHDDMAECHQGPGCVPGGYVLPGLPGLNVAAPIAGRGLRPESMGLPDSLALRRDLPPPRA